MPHRPLSPKGRAAPLARYSPGMQVAAGSELVFVSGQLGIAADGTTPSADVPTPPSERAQEQMIRGMVERLAARLQQDGSDVDGWIRLVRSYMVLGEREKAHAAITDARRALKDEPEKLRRLDDGAKSLGING